MPCPSVACTQRAGSPVRLAPRGRGFLLLQRRNRIRTVVKPAVGCPLHAAQRTRPLGACSERRHRNMLQK
jgi:hypothetical protein